MLRPRRHLPSAAVAAILAAGTSIAILPAAERHVHVVGRVTDADGKGLVGQTVRLFKTKRSLTIGNRTSGGHVAEAARVATDDGGFYEIDVPKDRAFDDWFLRFYDAATFDQVQYRFPPDREITRDVRRGETLRADVTLERRPDWVEVSRRIASLGDDSPQGRLLRSMGAPEREKQGAGPDGPREEWWYYSRGVVYFFRNGQPAGSRRFDPVEPSAPAAAPAGGGI